MIAGTIGLLTMGLASSLAVGPASFSIIRNLINHRKWPWRSIAGFLLGDLIYIAVTILFLQTPLVHEAWLRRLLTAMTVAVLLFYSVRVLFLSPKEQSIEVSPQSFTRSLMLTLANFHLLFIYAGLFMHLSELGWAALWQGISLYLLSFIAGFLGLLWSLKKFHTYLKLILRKIEIIAACGFFGFSIYLSLEIL